MRERRPSRGIGERPGAPAAGSRSAVMIEPISAGTDARRPAGTGRKLRPRWRLPETPYRICRPPVSGGNGNAVSPELCGASSKIRRNSLVAKGLRPSAGDRPKPECRNNRLWRSASLPFSAPVVPRAWSTASDLKVPGVATVIRPWMRRPSARAHLLPDGLHLQPRCAPDARLFKRNRRAHPKRRCHAAVHIGPPAPGGFCHRGPSLPSAASRPCHPHAMGA